MTIEDALMIQPDIGQTPSNSIAPCAIKAMDEGVDKLAPPETTLERNFSRTKATFGPGAVVLEIQTAFESRRVTLSNLSDEIPQKEITDLAEVFGALKSVVRTLSAPGIAGKAELEYLDINSAKTAAAALDGHILHSRLIAAQLNLKSVDVDTADLRSSTLKISWFAPSRTAYAHYPTISVAREQASVLGGKKFAGRKVSVTFQEPTLRQRTSFTVIVKGLPLNVQLSDLERFCDSQDVTISKANYHGKEGAASFRKRLEEYGPLESFDYVHPKMNDLKVKVHVRFSKPEHASAAEKALHGESQDFLGGTKTWITLLHSVKYNIPLAQFHALKDAFHQMQRREDQSAKIRIYDVDEFGRAVDPICVRIYGDQPKALGQLKSSVEALVFGEELKYEGVSVWDEFFHGEGSRPFLEHVQTESGAFVRRDTRRKKLQVSGEPVRRKIAHELLLKKALELRTQRHRISLTNVELGRLVQGGLTRLQALMGHDKLALDIRTRTLIVQGEEEDIKVAKLSLMAVESTVVIPEIENGGDCPVCFGDLAKPVQLACGHSYCFACLNHYLISVDSFPVNCLAEGGKCDHPIPLATISHILSPADETRLFDTSFLAHIHQHPTEFHYCPTPDCQLIYRSGERGMVIRCSACLARICPHCHVENHEGLTCEQHQDNKTGGDLSFMTWKQENNVSACPGCGVSIEKNGGCNHITCVCGTHMCWVCKKTFDVEEIYKHMNKAHGL